MLTCAYTTILCRYLGDNSISIDLYLILLLFKYPSIHYYHSITAILSVSCNNLPFKLHQPQAPTPRLRQAPPAAAASRVSSNAEQKKTQWALSPFWNMQARAVCSA